jgi:hypothetical protein
VPYSEEAHYRPEDMMTLCPNCHAAATYGALTIADQRKFKANPVNLQRGLAQGMMHIHQSELRIVAGDNFFLGGGPLITVDGEVLVAFELESEGHLALYVKLYDADDNLIMSVDKNVWQSGDIELWDIDYRYQRLKVRSRKRKVELHIDARNSPVQFYANIWRHGHVIEFEPRRIRLDRKGFNLAFSRCEFVRTGFDVITQPEVTIEI